MADEIQQGADTAAAQDHTEDSDLDTDTSSNPDDRTNRLVKEAVNKRNARFEKKIDAMQKELGQYKLKDRLSKGNISLNDDQMNLLAGVEGIQDLKDDELHAKVRAIFNMPVPGQRPGEVISFIDKLAVAEPTNERPSKFKKHLT